MPKCPHCGSTAQVKEKETIYDENGWEIYVTRRYYCGCGCCFSFASIYTCNDEYEELEIEEITIKEERPYEDRMD